MSRKLDRPDAISAAVAELSDATWSLSAIASVLARSSGGAFPATDHPARILTSLGLFEESSEGLKPTAAFAQLLTGREAALANGIRSTLGQAASAAFASEHAGWGGFDDEILIAQGRASAMGGRMLADLVIPGLDGLAERFARGGTFLDVGVGVAELACAFLRAVPGSRVVGIDALPRAIDLARRTVADYDLLDRIELRIQAVEDLDDIDAFDLAWLPAPFIPGPAVAAGIHRIRRALRPGGWLLVPGAAPGGDLSGDVTRWQVHLAGGTLLTDEERRTLLLDAGFLEPIPLATPPGAPATVAARRPT